jgi:tetratricopeptide (TPR) repeat protein
MPDQVRHDSPKKPMRHLLATLFVLASLGIQALAAPFTPKSDAEVVQKLPSSAADPSVRRVDSMRKQLASRPADVALRIEIARRYFDLAMAQGDPRYVGYASATIAPINKGAINNAKYWLVLGLIQQYSHDFNGALQSLEKASEVDPKSPESVSWRAAIHMVQANYPRALAECTRLVPLTPPIHALGCTAYVQASTGSLQPAYEMLTKEFGLVEGMTPEFSLWVRTRLAEMATRLRKFDEAQHHYLEARKLGVTDQFLLAAYADFLIQQNRPYEAMTLLADWERSDVLLLRLALAGKATGETKATTWAADLRERFKAAAMRGDSLHEQEAARFELDIEGNAGAALAYATKNYQSQKEPRDAEILMRAALAANNVKAAQPALDWLRNSRYEDPGLAGLADQLVARGAAR